jgi:hypothetical protein
MGTGTIYRLSGLTGWDDLPPLDMSDVPRPNAAGAYPGTIFAGERLITTDITIVTDPASYPAALAALRAATVPTAAESPLAIQWGGQKLQAGVRCTGRVVGPDGWALGIERAALKWTASDPRRYTTALSSGTTAPPTASGGVTWPITWPITWATLGGTGVINVANSGDCETPPVITVAGPLTTPAVYRLDTGDVLELNTTLAASDIVVIDVLADTLTLNGAPAKNLLTDRSAPVSSFLMPAGTTGLALREAAGPDPTALMTVAYRSAYL